MATTDTPIRTGRTADALRDVSLERGAAPTDVYGLVARHFGLDDGQTP